MVRLPAKKWPCLAATKTAGSVGRCPQIYQLVWRELWSAVWQPCWLCNSATSFPSTSWCERWFIMWIWYVTFVWISESGAEKLLDNQARPSNHSAMQCIRKGEQAADVIINPWQLKGLELKHYFYSFEGPNKETKYRKQVFFSLSCSNPNSATCERPDELAVWTAAASGVDAAVYTGHTQTNQVGTYLPTTTPPRPTSLLNQQFPVSSSSRSRKGVN